MAKVVKVKVPNIGDFQDVDVIEVLVSAGDRVKAEDSLITLESDKATMEIPSPQAGTVTAVAVSVGDKVSEGALILSLDTGELPAPATPPLKLPSRPRVPRAGQTCMLRCWFLAPVRGATPPPFGRRISARAWCLWSGIRPWAGCA